MDYWYLKSYRHDVFEFSQDKLMFPGLLEIFWPLAFIRWHREVFTWKNIAPDPGIQCSHSQSWVRKLLCRSLIVWDSKQSKYFPSKLLFLQKKWMPTRWTLLTTLSQVIRCQVSLRLFILGHKGLSSWSHLGNITKVLFCLGVT